MNYPSKLVEDAVNEISRLPGIGKKSALRLALHLLGQEVEDVTELTKSLIALRQKTVYCKKCHTISDTDVCSICKSPKRNESLICVVEEVPDLLAIENTAQYNGLYHVLGGVISPIEGISPSDLNIDSLLDRTQNGEVKEVILALNATMEGDTTAFYLTKKLRKQGIRVSGIARGVPIGSELEYTDEITLGRSIAKRIMFD
ncbi:DNA replication and repair protein RecR [Bernardetia litoralis DSM 6794]|uniref:Recombination protein RecR n=1 Tax=Bernardetia litoralis (strain ATCC 23117 / DSM 6794 / NBRC 15988 / NCIMB 1366 / Fx l1 / Sio-4) TaxID=880071 RepID=I4AKI3_BERLS|nr:recombination mediator RecR [Bernardetia litoralis]AFM04468.1 DNA replication and repair protein RecR [Bernardetia litoralis DSM 6794]